MYVCTYVHTYVCSPGPPCRNGGGLLVIMHFCFYVSMYLCCNYVSMYLCMYVCIYVLIN